MSVKLRVSVFNNRTHLLPSRTAQLTLDEFVGWMRRSSQIEVANKRSNRLVTTARFAGPRCLANVESITGLWLDNDDGNPTHELLLDLFPGLRMVVFNTYSTRADRPKYRAFIPTAQGMTAEEYARLWSGVIAKIKAVCPKHGFDPAPKHAAAIFYLPCRPASGEAADSFLIDRPGELMDVTEYVAQSEAAKQTSIPPLGVPMDRIRSALTRISSDDRITWFSVLCALHHELGDSGKELGRCWSMSSRKYDPQDYERTWRSITRGKPRKPITIATLFYFASTKGGQSARPDFHHYI